MKTAKIEAALQEIDEQIAVLVAARESLNRALGVLSDTPSATDATNEFSARPHIAVQHHQPITSDESSYIDDAVTVYRAHGKPLHIKRLAEEISKLRGVEISRASIESSLIRHIKKAKAPRLAKFAASTYGLPEWKTQAEFPLAHSA